MAVSGCGTPESSGRPIALDLFTDASNKEESILIRYASQAYKAQRNMEDSDRLTVSVFGHECHAVYDDPPLTNRETFNEKVASKLEEPNARRDVPGTRADLVLEAMNERVNGASLPCVEVVQTDGGVEDQSEEVLSRIRTAVAKMSHASKLQKLVVVGVHDQWRSLWEGWLRPLGQKAVVRGVSDGDRILDEAVAEAREVQR